MEHEKQELVLPKWLEDERSQARYAALQEDLARQSAESARSGAEWAKRPNRAAPMEEPRPRRQGEVQLYDPRELETFLADLPRHHANNEDRKRAKLVLEKIAALGPWRTPLRLSKATRLMQLRRDFPNFHAVLDALEGYASLGRSAGVRIPPMVLNGPPGCGKSLFANHLAAVLRVPSRRMDMAAAQAAFALIGSDKAYDNSQTGAVFELLAFNRSCSPLLILDEIDKAGGDGRYPVIGSLYALLEPETARDFRDASIPLGLDSRHTILVGTSNQVELLPDPIRNRIRVFDIEPADPNAMRGIVQRMAATIWQEAGRRDLMPVLSNAVMDRLVAMPARTAKLALTEAFGRAVLRGRNEVVVEDLPPAPSAPKRIGFA